MSRTDLLASLASHVNVTPTKDDHGEVRADQEREVAISHRLTSAEYALAREAVFVGRTFARAGIVFDPVTFVALRILEGSLEEAADPIDCLRVLGEVGLLERSVTMVSQMLDEAA